MPRLVEALSLKGNPFEHYVAETEPNIADYAVKPPYFEAIDARAKNTSSFVLFGDRGAGKSATRLTIFKELWAQKAGGKRVPLAVNMTDFSVAVQGKKIHNLSEELLVREIAFITIESLLTWLSSLEDEDRSVFVQAMTAEENSLCYALLRDHYLSRPAAKRERSAREAMQLLNQAFTSKSKLWIEQRWDAISGVLATVVEALAKRNLDAASVAGDAKRVMALKEEGFDAILTLRRLVDLAKIFDFSGVVLLVDKVDETEATINSADQTAALVHPILSHVQLMEIAGFSLVFFLWARIKASFEGDTYPVRLDKIGHATVTWDDQFFSLMLNRRVNFFSEARHGFEGLFVAGTDIDKIYADLIKVSMRSPRELIRIMDVIIREHDVLNAAKPEPVLLDREAVDTGLDKYVTDVITTIYGERLLAQLFRLNKAVFTNKDVQLTFRVGPQSARTRIQSWENAGIIKFTGTRAAEGALGGKPANEYTIVDGRIERIMQRNLISYPDNVVEEPEFELEGLAGLAENQ